MCLSNPQYTSDIEGQLRKQFGKINIIKRILKILMTLTLVHQKGALSYKKVYRMNDELKKRIPPDINKFNLTISQNELTAIALNNMKDTKEAIKFYSDSVNTYILIRMSQEVSLVLNVTSSKVHILKFLSDKPILLQVKLQ